MNDNTTDRVMGAAGALHVSRLPLVGDYSASPCETDVGALLDGSPCPAWILDAETFDFLAANRRSTARYGYTLDEFLALNVRDICHPDDHLNLLDRFRRLPYSFDDCVTLRHRLKFGAQILVESAGQAIRHGGRRAILMIMREVTESVRTMERLRETVERSHLIVQFSPDAIIEIDSVNRIISWNRQAEVMFGWSAMEAIGRRASDMIIPSGRRTGVNSGRADLFAVQEGQETSAFECTVRRRDGEQFPVEIAVTPIPTANGTHYCAYLREVPVDFSSLRREQQIGRFLERASEILESSCDYEQTAQSLADLAVPQIADWCAVDTLDEHGNVHLTAASHVDSTKVNLIFAIRRGYPLHSGEGGASQAHHTGDPELLSDIPDSLLTSWARDSLHLAMIHQVGCRSRIVVPIVARGRVLGAITLGATSASGRRFTEADLAVAEALAARAAAAMEYSRLYRAARDEAAHREKVQESLRASDERFRFALADSDISVYMQDRELRYTWVYSGATSEELTDLYGKTDAEILIPEDAARLMEIKQRVLDTEQEARYIVRATVPGGEPRYFDTVFAPLRDSAGCITGITGTVNDITARKKTQDALAEKRAQIEALNARLQRSMSETHHRVKNNLQVVSALLDMQEMQYGDAVPVSEISRLRQHVQALSMVHDLLTHQAKKDADVYDLPVRDAIGRLIPLVQGLVPGREIQCSVEEIRLPVYQITTFTVLVNELVSNAIKHGSGNISLAVLLRDGKVVLEVSDEGPGFPESFDPVTAAHTGLELIQTLAQLELQGECRFENHSRGGARVAIEFTAPAAMHS